jgi:segregation and condensation protein A
MPAPDALAQALDLDLFAGPLDLLVTLVLREEVDLGELPLAELVPVALAPPDGGEWDLDATSRLALILAALAELKARRLLRDPEEEEPDADAAARAEALAARLIACMPYARVARRLAERRGAAAGPRRRRVALPVREPSRPREDPAGLRTRMERLLERPPEPSLAHLTRRVSVPELLVRLRAALGGGRVVSFEALVGDGDRLHEVVTLLAALELARRGEVVLDQPAPFGDITIRTA